MSVLYVVYSYHPPDPFMRGAFINYDEAKEWADRFEGPTHYLIKLHTRDEFLNVLMEQMED